MRQRLISAGSSALWLGLVCALTGAVADAVVLSRSPSFGTLAFYFFCGWAAGLAYGVLSNRVVLSLPALSSSKRRRVVPELVEGPFKNRKFQAPCFSQTVTDGIRPRAIQSLLP